MLLELFAFSLGIRLIRISFLWSAPKPLPVMVLDGRCKKKWDFLSTLLYAIENVLDLRRKASPLSLPVAFVSGSVFPSTADSLAVLKGLGAVLFWNSQRKTIAVR